MNNYKMPKMVWALGWVSLFTDWSTHMVTVLFPLYLQSVMQVPISSIGWIEGIAEGLSGVMKWLGGRAVDRANRHKKWLLWGYGISNFSRMLLLIWGSALSVLSVRLLDRFGKGLRVAPRDALIALHADPKHRGAVFGFRRMMDTIGATIGPVCASIVMYLTQQNFGWVFGLAMIPGILAVIVLLLYVNPQKEIVPNLSASEHLQGQVQTEIQLGKPFFIFTAVMSVFSIFNVSDAFLSLRAADVNISFAFVPLLFMLVQGVSALFSIPAGKLADRIGKHYVICIGLFVYAIVYAIIGNVNHPAIIILCFAGYGVFYACTDGVQKAYITDMVPEGHRGRAMGIYQAWTGIALLPASIMGGYIWQIFGSRIMFSGCAVVAALTAIVVGMKWGARE